MRLLALLGFRARRRQRSFLLLLLALFLTILTLTVGQEQQQQEYGMHDSAEAVTAEASTNGLSPSDSNPSNPSNDGDTITPGLPTHNGNEEPEAQHHVTSDRVVLESVEEIVEQDPEIEEDEQQESLHADHPQQRFQQQQQQHQQQQQKDPFKERTISAFGMHPNNGTATSSSSSSSSSHKEQLLKKETNKMIPDTASAGEEESSSSAPFFTKTTTTTPLGTTRFTIEELERLLIRLSNDDDDDDDDNSDDYDNNILAHQQQQHEQKQPIQYPLAEEAYLDDRTLLDIFGEVAKEFLTQKVIPQTNETCHWDWRSLQCEPACECEFQARWGDYHLGRSCRLRDESSSAATEQQQSFCPPFMDPASLAQEVSWPQRVWWLMRRTAKGVRRRSQRLVQGMVVKSAARLSELQTNVCSELWDLLYHHENNNEHQQQQTCWPPRQVPIATIPERILCGPIEFPICGKENNPASSQRQEMGMPGSAQRVYTGNAS